VSMRQAVLATRAKAEAIAARTHAEEQRLRAEAGERAAVEARQVQSELRSRAELGELQARRTSYAAEMNVAQQALADGNLLRATQLLQKYVPKPGEQDLRSFEWRYLWSRARSDEIATLGKIVLGTTTGNAGGTWGGAVAISPDGSLLAHRGGERDTI